MSLKFVVFKSILSLRCFFNRHLCLFDYKVLLVLILILIISFFNVDNKSSYKTVHRLNDFVYFFLF